MSLLPHPGARTPRLYRINAGSCNGCDVELATTACVARYDVERLGCAYCDDPRHADILLITGPLTVRVKDSVLREVRQAPEPRVTIAIGICPISGGLFRDSYAVASALDRHVPVDINVPGCPPRPPAILEGVAQAMALWRARL